jgi:hypothetical protein
MKKHYILYWLATLLIVFSLTGCAVVSAFSPTETPTNTPLPTLTPTPTVTPTPTQIPFYLNATVWNSDLEVPILIYHEFVPNYMNTDATKMRLEDFENELQAFYDNGYSLISLKEWINGTFTLPEGKKPMILTIDDLWFGNQIFINDDGTPNEYSGIGVLWKFNQEHPDFGFKAALFAINGDKYYPEKVVGDLFQAAEGIDWNTPSWRIKLGNTIAWAVDNGLEVYNHTLHHYFYWPTSTDAVIKSELSENDYTLRDFLNEAGRSDVIAKLDNIIALPQGLWPDSYSGKQIVMNYKNPEGKPVMAIMEAYNMDAAQLTPSIFSGKLDPNHIARITASKYMTNFIVNQKDQVPTMMGCKLGPMEESQSNNFEVIQTAIQTAINSQACPEGVYNVNGSVFVAKAGTVTLFKANTGAAAPEQSTPTVTITP